MTADYASAIRKATLEATRLQRDLGIQAKVVHEFGRVDVYDTIARLRVPLMFTRLDGLLGAYYREPTPGVLVTTQRPLNQQRYTAAHELGHYYLGHTPSLDDETILRRAPFQARAGDNPQEVEAEAFAAAFLLPRWLLDWHCDQQNWTDAGLQDPALVYQLALRVGTSYRATVWTLHRYDVFDRATARFMINIKLKQLKQKLLRGYCPENFRDVDVWLVTERDANLRLHGGPKDLFVVRLPEHSGAGYLWQIESMDGEALAIVADRREDQDGEGIGGPTMRLITAAARDRRAGELRLAERRPWQPAKPFKTFAVQYNLTGAEQQGWYRDQRQQHRKALEAA
jgi:Zn-dependent peptidase ImmA (M78 family)/predicted secreted protein